MSVRYRRAVRVGDVQEARAGTSERLFNVADMDMSTVRAS